MVISAVTIANLFNGLNTNVWTGWVFFAVFIGIALVLLYTVSISFDLNPSGSDAVTQLIQAVYNSISPGWFVTPVWGNNTFLWPSAYFWFCLPLTICLALAPRYLAKAWKFGFAPDDFDIMRYISKKEPGRDIARDAQLGGGLKAMQRPGLSRRSSRTDSIVSGIGGRSSLDHRQASRTDMSTGERLMERGFDFSTEEQGVAMRRMQTSLSELRHSSRNLAAQVPQDQPKKKQHHIFSVGRGFLRRKSPTPQED
jgi:phospholipid-translocating ATPase